MIIHMATHTPINRLRKMVDYLHDPAEIYQASFAAIREHADLSQFEGAMEDVALRLIHACGMPEIVDDLDCSVGAAEQGVRALADGAPILVDAEMVAHGIIRKRLSSNNPVICTLNDEGVADRAIAAGTTRSAMAVDVWGEQLAGAVVAVGNAPTALFRLLELIDDGAPKPALILGFPVGFIGAAESKRALADRLGDVPFITLHGRRGGSAMAAAAVNALAGKP